MDEYLEHSNFLADINNERKLKNSTYAKNLARLNKLVMYAFKNDTTLIPKESEWFAEVNGTSKEVTPLRERKIFTEDWVGLRALDKKEGLEFKELPGEHMHFSEKELKETFKEWFGPVKESMFMTVQDDGVISSFEL